MEEFKRGETVKIVRIGKYSAWMKNWEAGDIENIGVIEYVDPSSFGGGSYAGNINVKLNNMYHCIFCNNLFLEKIRTNKRNRNNE